MKPALALDGLNNWHGSFAAFGLHQGARSQRNITKPTTSLINRAHRKPVYEAIGRRSRDVFPISTGLVVTRLPLPEHGPCRSGQTGA
jgi:hypothetical protein